MNDVEIKQNLHRAFGGKLLSEIKEEQQKNKQVKTPSKKQVKTPSKKQVKIPSKKQVKTPTKTGKKTQ